MPRDAHRDEVSQPGEEASPSGVLFVDRGRLLTRTLFDAITTTTPLALHPSGEVWRYRDGRFVFDRQRLAWEVAGRLGDHFKKAHLDNLLAYAAARLADQGLVLDNAPARLVNVANGMLDPLTGELYAHDPEHLSIAQWPVAWDPSARCPTFDWWVQQVQPDDTLREALIEDASTVLDRRRLRQKRALFVIGPTRSGKSTLARLLEALVGTANRASEELGDLAANRFRAAELFGKDLNVASDISAAHLGDVGLFKKATGADTISAERKFGHPFQFRFHGLFVLTMNQVPTVSDHSGAYLTRVRPYRFSVSFAGREDPSIEEAMHHELPGILATLVAGLQKLEARPGYLVNDATEVEARWFARQSDQVLLFLDEATRPGGFAKRGWVHQAFSEWAKDHRRGGMTRQALYAALEAVGYEVVTRRGQRGFRLTLADDYDTDEVEP